MGIRVSEFQNKHVQRSRELLLIYIQRGEIWPRGPERSATAMVSLSKSLIPSPIS